MKTVNSRRLICRPQSVRQAHVKTKFWVKFNIGNTGPSVLHRFLMVPPLPVTIIYKMISWMIILGLNFTLLKNKKNCKSKLLGCKYLN